MRVSVQVSRIALLYKRHTTITPLKLEPPFYEWFPLLSEKPLSAQRYWIPQLWENPAHVLWSQERERGGGYGSLSDVPAGLEASSLPLDAHLSLFSPYWTLRAPG